MIYESEISIRHFERVLYLLFLKMNPISSGGKVLALRVIGYAKRRKCFPGLLVVNGE